MEEKKTNGMSVASLVLGIIALVLTVVFSWLPGATIIALILSIVGLVLAIMGRKKKPSGVGTAGLVLNIIALILSAILFVACTACTACVGGAVDDAISSASSLYYY